VQRRPDLGLAQEATAVGVDVRPLVQDVLKAVVLQRARGGEERHGQAEHPCPEARAEEQRRRARAASKRKLT